MNNLRLRYGLAISVVILSTILSPLQAKAWDSQHWNPTHPTHSYLTEWAIAQLQPQASELQQYSTQIVEGANTELHELPVSGSKYGVDLNAKRIQHKGTNAGCDDIQGWWQDSLSAYRNSNKKQAYFVTGIMLHMIEDMGVPAHANNVIHQGTLREFDNFEFMGLSNWKPSFANINRQDPGYTEPWRYYAFSKDWTHADAPNYNNRNSFSKTWFFASRAERQLLSDRQGRTSTVIKWALASAITAFGK